MPVRSRVRDAQGAVAALELNDRHVADWLEDVLARRADVLTDQDRLVAALQAAPALALIGEDPEAGHGYEGKTGASEEAAEA